MSSAEMSLDVSNDIFLCRDGASGAYTGLSAVAQAGLEAICLGRPKAGWTPLPLAIRTGHQVLISDPLVDNHSGGELCPPSMFERGSH